MNKSFRSLFIIFSLIISHNILSNPIPSGSALSIVAPVTIVNPGNYTLANDIVGTITIAADGVDLNLNNKTIDGSGDSNCIEVTGQENITIRNGKVENAPINGISLDTVNNVKVHEVDFVANGTGFFVSAGNCVVLEKSTLRNHTVGAVCLGGGSANVVIAYNKILSNQQGIIFLGVVRSVIANNLINQSTANGIVFTGGFTNNQNTVEYNQISASGVDGITGGSGDFSTFAHNIIEGSTGRGIDFSGTINNLTIIGNEISGNAVDGMQLTGGVNNCVVEKNICNSNGTMGIRAGTSFTLYKGNICSDNGGSGLSLLVAGSDMNTFTENVLENNVIGLNLTMGTDNVVKFNWASHNSMTGFVVNGASNASRTVNNHAIENPTPYTTDAAFPAGTVLAPGAAAVVGQNLMVV